MSTIASPRPSITSLVTPTSSRRPSLDTVTRSQTTSPSRPPHPQQRRNRAALRDYYGLKGSAPEETPSEPESKDDVGVEESELDDDGFDADAYVRGLLEKEGLEGVLKVEGRLVNEIRNLDGERKALVYDNYSKLITATDTIRNMRSNMDPLAPTTSTLAPAISHIAEVSATLATALRERSPTVPDEPAAGTSSDKERQRQTARWVMDAPQRFRELMRQGKRGEVSKEWADVSRFLDKWDGVEGVSEVWQACIDAQQADSEAKLPTT
ncbi:MAG: hypothetical protein M1838_005350 [Thelocarpon superellum]|nr:MAG: hypothetical protein M1838_005350 [Thelocarpon superellum]